MSKKSIWLLTSLLVLVAVVLNACAGAQTPAATQPPVKVEEPTTAATQAPQPTNTEAVKPTEPPLPTSTLLPKFVFGLLMVGPYNDHGWSQAHFEAGLYVQQKFPGAEMVYVDKVNSADRPGTTPEQLAEDLVAKGAKVVIFNSDDMKDGALAFAKAHPEITVIHASGDAAWKDGKDYQNLPNLSNVMGKMEYGKMMAGCAAALTTQTGKIGYLGPLINDETRRLVASAYLGAKYCWTEYLKKDPKALSFKVTWIGFWFNIPGVTSDPTQVANDFFNNKYGEAKTRTNQNTGGISLGGPLRIPKVYNGRDRTHYSASYERVVIKEREELRSIVPTVLQRGGDLSRATDRFGNPSTIYDPDTTRPQGSGFIRDPFPGKVIPAGRLDKVASQTIRYYPPANLTPVPGDPGEFSDCEGPQRHLK